MTIDIVFETHSLSEDNDRGIATGWLPGRLSERGRRLAVELGDRRRDNNLSAVFTSDLARAARLCANATTATSTVPPPPRCTPIASGTSTSPIPAAKAGARPSPAFAASWTTCRPLVRHENPGDRTRGDPVGLRPLPQRTALEDLADADFAWQEGWEYRRA